MIRPFEETTLLRIKALRLCRRHIEEWSIEGRQIFFNEVGSSHVKLDYAVSARLEMNLLGAYTIKSLRIRVVECINVEPFGRDLL